MHRDVQSGDGTSAPSALAGSATASPPSLPQPPPRASAFIAAIECAALQTACDCRGICSVARGDRGRRTPVWASENVECLRTAAASFCKSASVAIAAMAAGSAGGPRRGPLGICSGRDGADDRSDGMMPADAETSQGAGGGGDTVLDEPRAAMPEFAFDAEGSPSQARPTRAVVEIDLSSGCVLRTEWISDDAKQVRVPRRDVDMRAVRYAARKLACEMWPPSLSLQSIAIDVLARARELAVAARGFAAEMACRGLRAPAAATDPAQARELAVPSPPSIRGCGAADERGPSSVGGALVSEIESAAFEVHAFKVIAVSEWKTANRRCAAGATRCDAQRIRRPLAHRPDAAAAAAAGRDETPLERAGRVRPTADGEIAETPRSASGGRGPRRDFEGECGDASTDESDQERALAADEECDTEPEFPDRECRARTAPSCDADCASRDSAIEHLLGRRNSPAPASSMKNLRMLFQEACARRARGATSEDMCQ